MEFLFRIIFLEVSKKEKTLWFFWRKWQWCDHWIHPFNQCI